MRGVKRRMRGVVEVRARNPRNPHPKPERLNPKRGGQEDEGYSDLVKYWMDERYTLRYTGGLVIQLLPGFLGSEKFGLDLSSSSLL